MAKALFGHVVAPAELRVAEENAVLRAKVRRLEQELEGLRAQRDAAIAHELLSLAGDNAEPALACRRTPLPPATRGLAAGPCRGADRWAGDSPSCTSPA